MDKKRKLFLASLSMSKWHHPHQQRPFITIAEKSMHLYIVLHMSFICHSFVIFVSHLFHLFLISVLRLKVLRPAVPCACIISRVFCICEPRVLVWRGRAGAETTWRTGASSWRDGLSQIWMWWGNLTYPNHVSNVLSYIYIYNHKYFFKKKNVCFGMNLVYSI